MSGYMKRGLPDAFDDAKIQKCKQFTTHTTKSINVKKMLLMMQRYKNVSNSQRYHVALHVQRDAFDDAKIQKCKQFTTLSCMALARPRMLLMMQRYKNVSNSQLIGVDIPGANKMLLMMQRYKNVSNSQPNS